MKSASNCPSVSLIVEIDFRRVGVSERGSTAGDEEIVFVPLHSILRSRGFFKVGMSSSSMKRMKFTRKLWSDDAKKDWS